MDSDSVSYSTDSSLLARVKQNEQDAWHAFVKLYGPLIYGWARRSGISSEDAADVLQETLLALARNLRGAEQPPIRSFRAWLWTITTNKIRDYFRRSPKQERAIGGTSLQQWLEQNPADSSSEHSQFSNRNDLAGLVQRACLQIQAEFEPRTWQAFERTVIHGDDTASVAAELGLMPASVRQARCRVLRRLRDQLAGLDP